MYSTVWSIVHYYGDIASILAKISASFAALSFLRASTRSASRAVSMSGSFTSFSCLQTVGNVREVYVKVASLFNKKNGTLGWKRTMVIPFWVRCACFCCFFLIQFYIGFFRTYKEPSESERVSEWKGCICVKTWLCVYRRLQQQRTYASISFSLHAGTAFASQMRIMALH